ncbi:MAG: RagB/SusD family nutrient uptake outer membrane protein [Prevotella sp.]|nr:RagB/SusD family nutrient uptake outer membrane protein [Prevotella sp.]
MKKTIKYIGCGLISAFVFSSCSDSFLDDKKNYDNVSSDLYNYYSGANGRVNYVYAWCLPTPNVVESQLWKYPSAGSNDLIGKSTEEYSGFGSFVDPDKLLSSNSSTNQVPDYFMNTNSNIQESVYGRIRNINDCISGIQGGSLSDDEKNTFLGQCYFFRAWCYYNLVKWYGGVSIVTNVQEPVESSVTQRSSAKDCIAFILSDLDKSAKMLASKTLKGGWGSSDYGRVTTGTALALKGRTLLLWCSPLFNRSNDESRWKSAYDTMKSELDSINACGYGLYSTSNNVNGSDFASMFSQTGRNPEAVFITLFNNFLDNGLNDTQKNNAWERYIRPSNTTGSGKNASAMIIDMFPMADGKRPTTCNTYTKLEASDSTYDESYPFVGRDPRFYRTFAFPGFRWAYSGDPTQADSHNPSYDSGKNYAVWNYVWYTSLSDQGNPESGNSYGADNFLTSKSGVYVRKKSDDYDVNNSPLYQWNAKDASGGFAHSGAQHMEIRYAEVLLNLAEVACGANQLSDAVALLQKIRARAGYSASNNYGLQSNLTSDQAACMSAIIYERQIEFAYEGKRFDDLRRWMLFDGGATKVAGAPSTWTLTGWGGNTCTWLGFKPLNGQRRENMEFRVADKYGVGGTTYDSDPLVKSNVTRCAAVDLRKDLSPQLQTLKAWYKNNLVLKIKKGDAQNANHVDEYMYFNPRYYFLGLCSGASNINKSLPQTVGWEDSNNGGAAGTFDPLAQ